MSLGLAQGPDWQTRWLSSAGGRLTHGTMPDHRFQVLALDVDGTLLDPGGNLRPRTLAAVARAARAGIQPILCTGRRYRRAWPIARQLELDAPLVPKQAGYIT
jgi:hydroxymethylpyrimidine pyrophosphatase-like HAD family hydrolase